MHLCRLQMCMRYLTWQICQNFRCYGCQTIHALKTLTIEQRYTCKLLHICTIITSAKQQTRIIDAQVLQLLPQLHKLDNDDVANRTPIAAETFAPPAANTSAVQPAQTSPTQVCALTCYGCCALGEIYHSGCLHAWLAFWHMQDQCLSRLRHSTRCCNVIRLTSLLGLQAQKPLSSTVSPAPDAVLSPNTAANEQPSFHPEKAAFISPSQLPTAVAPPSIEPAASMPPGRSNVLYAVIALLAELDVGSLHIVQAEVTVNRDAPS